MRVGENTKRKNNRVSYRFFFFFFFFYFTHTKNRLNEIEKNHIALNFDGEKLLAQKYVFKTGRVFEMS